jgi:hypothetical protein
VTVKTDMKAGSVIGECMPRHRAQEFQRFHDEVEHNVPTRLDVHVVTEPQNAADLQLARQATALASSLHADFPAMDQSGRTHPRTPIS